MDLLKSAWILAFVFAFVYFGAGKQNATVPGGKNYSFLWAGLSIAVSAVVIRFFQAGWVLVLVSQLALFAAIGIFRSFPGR